MPVARGAPPGPSTDKTVFHDKRGEIVEGLLDYEVTVKRACLSCTNKGILPGMPRKPLPGPSRLSQILKHFQQEPIPTLPALRALRLTYALRNDHMGARHFVKEDLPRIAYANPTLNIVVNKKDKKKEDTLLPEMLLEFRDGSRHKIDMEKKWSSAIFTELLEAHGKRATNVNVGEAPTAGRESEQRRRGERSMPPHLAAGSKRTSTRDVPASP